MAAKQCACDLSTWNMVRYRPALSVHYLCDGKENPQRIEIRGFSSPSPHPFPRLVRCVITLCCCETFPTFCSHLKIHLFCELSPLPTTVAPAPPSGSQSYVIMCALKITIMLYYMLIGTHLRAIELAYPRRSTSSPLTPKRGLWEMWIISTPRLLRCVISVVIRPSQSEWL